MLGSSNGHSSVTVPAWGHLHLRGWISCNPRRTHVSHVFISHMVVIVYVEMLYLHNSRVYSGTVFSNDLVTQLLWRYTLSLVGHVAACLCNKHPQILTNRKQL
jgi:hypothetical protein